jgi:hypothetical protein
VVAVAPQTKTASTPYRAAAAANPNRDRRPGPSVMIDRGSPGLLISPPGEFRAVSPGLALVRLETKRYRPS